jgi:O-antigen/teichoic acid export membrane protein
MTFHLPVGLTSHRLRQLWYAPVLALALGLMMVRVLIMARILDLSAFATYSAGLLVSSSFLMLGCLGLQSLLQREFPMLIVHRREFAGGVLTMQCGLVATACLAIGVAAVTLIDMSLAGLSPLLLVIALMHGLSLQLFLVATVESRSRRQPLRFANQNLFRALVLIFAGTTVAASGLGAAAVLVTEAMSSLILTAWLFRKQFSAVPLRPTAAIALAWRRFPRIPWRSALALLAVAFSSFIVTYADRWFAAQQLSVSAFAQYSFAWTVLMVAQSVQGLINTSLFPWLARSFAMRGGAIAYSATLKASLFLFAGGALMFLPLWALLDYSIAKWFSSYQEARSLIPVFLVIALFRLSDFWSSYLLVIGQEARLLILNFLSASVAALLWILWVWLDKAVLQISQVALLAFLLTAVGYTVAAGAAWYYSREFREKPR